MSWGLSSGGRVIDHTNPMASASKISMGEIAHSLATINRFCGHALRPISVAEHSLLVADILDEVMHLGPHAQLAGLMHDAHEVATGDMATPVKHQVGRPWHDFEGPWEHAFQSAFGLRLAFATYGPAIRRADLIALATERRDLMHPGGPPWPSLAGVQPLASVDLRSRDSFTWQDWRAAFEDRYDELLFAHTHHTQHTPKATA